MSLTARWQPCGPGIAHPGRDRRVGLGEQNTIVEASR